MTDVEVVHVHDGGGQNLCDQPGESIALDEARDPGDGKTFSCGRCLSALANVAEPSMGGSAG